MTSADPSEPISQLDADAILRTLLDHRVEFVLIGGLAVAVHGYPRATKDIDIVPRSDAENAARLFTALSAIGARPIELGDFRAAELPVAFDPDGLALGGNWALQTEHGRVDVMQSVPGIGGFEELTGNAFALDLAGVGVVPVAGYEDLVTMKTAAGRRLDEEDLARLREARGES